jgi:hypothetical protein
MIRWQITGFVAALLIVLSMPLYLFRIHVLERTSATKTVPEAATFVG